MVQVWRRADAGLAHDHGARVCQEKKRTHANLHWLQSVSPRCFQSHCALGARTALHYQFGPLCGDTNILLPAITLQATA